MACQLSGDGSTFSANTTWTPARHWSSVESSSGCRRAELVSAMRSAGEALTIRAEQAGRLWSGLTGMALDGTLTGAQLIAVSATYNCWFAWKDDHPEAVVYGAEISGRYGGDGG
jgi:hypothetical protein